MALIETEYLIDTCLRSMLESDHWTWTWRENLIVCWVLKFSVPFVAGTFARILTAVQTIAKGCAFCLGKILFDVIVNNLVWLDILQQFKNTQEIKTKALQDSTYIPIMLFKSTLVGNRWIDLILPKQVLDFESLRLDRLFKIQEFVNYNIFERSVRI